MQSLKQDLTRTFDLRRGVLANKPRQPRKYDGLDSKNPCLRSTLVRIRLYRRRRRISTHRHGRVLAVRGVYPSTPS